MPPRARLILFQAKAKGEAAASPFVQPSPNYFFGGAIVSFAALATRNFTTVFALILIAAPVCGLRPIRALRSAFTRRPMPGITNTPFFLVSLIAVSASRSRKAADCLLVSSSFSAICRVKAVLVNPVAIELFSFWASLLGSRVLPWVSADPGSSSSKSPERHRMEGVRLRQPLHEIPCIHAGFKNPVVVNIATSEEAKSMAKGRFPQFSWVFLGICTIFACIWPKTTAFEAALVDG